MQVTMETICMPSEDVVAREIEGDIIIVPLVAGIGNSEDELYSLNETGKAIWQKLDGQRSLGAVSSQLAEEYASSPAEGIHADVMGFAAEMVRRGILVIKN